MASFVTSTVDGFRILTMKFCEIRFSTFRVFLQLSIKTSTLLRTLQQMSFMSESHIFLMRIIPLRPSGNYMNHLFDSQ
jgi:hypothetical protein